MRYSIAIACCSLLSLAAAGCADLEPMVAGECGNGVVEPERGEECDSFPEGTCRPPGAEHECRLDCSETTCPDGYGCGLDGLCRKPSGKFESVNLLAVLNK